VVSIAKIHCRVTIDTHIVDCATSREAAVTSNVVTDENLRLIYAQQHESWLYDRIVATKRRLRHCIAVLCLGAVWLEISAVYGPQLSSGGTKCVILEGGATLQQVIRDGLVPDGSSECTPAEAAELRKAQDSKLSVGGIVVVGVSIFVLFITLLVAVEAVRSYLGIRRYRNAVQEHHALLDKYGRTGALPEV